MKLQGNFLTGAEKTLFIYFLVFEQTKDSFMSIFSSEENYSKFISVMKNNSYLDENKRLGIKKTFLAGVLIFLRKKGIIKNVDDVEIVKFLKEKFDFKISTPTFSNGIAYPTKDEEKKLFDDLSKEFMIKY